MYRTRLVLPSALALLAACAPSERAPAPVVYQGTVPSGASGAAPQPQPAPRAVAASEGVEDARGIVLYDGYETIRARRGDTVEAMASRAGLSGAELAAYNGLSTQYQPSAGDELVLPARADRYQNRVAVAPAPAAAPVPAPAPASQQTASSIPSTYQPSVAAPGDAAPAPAPIESASAQQVAPETNPGWSASLARAAIDAEPSPQPAPQTTAAVVEPTVVEPVQPAPVRQQPVQPAPTVTAPQTDNTVVALNTAPAVEPAVGSSARFLRPTSATISRPYSQAPGPDRNDGVDFATSGGDPVLAAGDGTVALVSKSLGGLGTILLVRHDNQYLTVYGRLGSVAVTKGDPVTRGQVIATVADLTAPKKPHLHFEVRKGAEAVDPTEYF